MASQSWVSLINGGNPASIGPGTALATATTATISPCQAGALTSDVAVVNPAGQPLGWYPGMLIRVTAYGLLTTTGTSTTATWLLAANKSNANGYTSIGTTVGVTTGTTVLTSLQWKLEAHIWCTAVASSGNTIDCQGNMNMFFTPNTPALTANPVALTLATPPGFALAIPNSAGPTATAIDTTSLQGIALRATLAGANATIQCTSWAVEALD